MILKSPIKYNYFGMSYYFMTFLLADDEKVASSLRNCPGVPDTTRLLTYSLIFESITHLVIYPCSDLVGCAVMYSGV